MQNEQEIVAEATKKAGSLYRVAKILGVNYSTAHAWKKGTATPRSKHLLRLIQLAGKTLAVMGFVTFIVTTPEKSYANTVGYNSNSPIIYIIRSLMLSYQDCWQRKTPTP
ncbi:MAG TPA: hypothetical protein VK642_13170 [Burkholderiales bacterium]|nr:hypothetical protein [Burkholderiales bacterium]